MIGMRVPVQFHYRGRMDSRIGARALAAALGGWRTREPAYEALADGIRLLCLDNRLAVRTLLPAERELAAVLGLSRTTVATAYRSLRDSGHIQSLRGSGSVTLPRPQREPGRVSVSGDAIDLQQASPSAWPGLAGGDERGGDGCRDARRARRLRHPRLPPAAQRHRRALHGARRAHRRRARHGDLRSAGSDPAAGRDAAAPRRPRADRDPDIPARGRSAARRGGTAGRRAGHDDRGLGRRPCDSGVRPHDPGSGIPDAAVPEPHGAHDDGEGGGRRSPTRAGGPARLW